MISDVFAIVSCHRKKRFQLLLQNFQRYFNKYFLKSFTIEPSNSHTLNSRKNSNSHTLFSLTKMWLIGYAKDIRKIRSLIFFSRWANHFLLFLKNCVIQDWIWGFSHSLFLYWHHFLCLKSLVNYEGIFLNQKISLRIINKNRSRMLESISLMRNPQGTQIVTNYPNSHIYPNSHRFFGFTQMWLYMCIWRLYSTYILDESSASWYLESWS